MPRGQACGRLTRQHEAMRVERHAAAFEPPGLRLRTHEKEHMAYRPFLLDASLVVAPGHGGKAPREIAVKLRQLRMRPQFDVRRGVDAVYQIARHASDAALA